MLDRAIAGAAAILDEAAAWGLDVDTWRAHLGPATWPEVLRQYALAAGWGPRRPRPKKQVRSMAPLTVCTCCLACAPAEAALVGGLGQQPYCIAMLTP